MWRNKLKACLLEMMELMKVYQSLIYINECSSELSLNYINAWVKIDWRVGVLSVTITSLQNWRNTRYDVRKSQRNKASKIQKLVLWCFIMLTSAKVKKIQDGDRLMRLYMSVSLQQRHLSKITLIVYQKKLTCFLSLCSSGSKMKYSLRLWLVR